MSAQHLRFRAQCPACGESEARTLVELPYDRPPLSGFLQRYYTRGTGIGTWLDGGSYRLDECSRCGLVFQRFVGDDALLTELYENWLSGGGPPDEDARFQAELDAPASSRDGHELFAASATLGVKITDLRVLDYGMGWGMWAIVARRLGARAFGYDLAPSRQAYAGARGVGVIHDLRDIPGLGLDFINTDQVLEHVESPRDVVALLATGLRPGGILKISVPQAPGISERAARLDWAGSRAARDVTAVHPLEHVNCFSRRALDALAMSAGLSPMRIPNRAYFAFLRVRDGVPTHSAAALLKALARPVYHRASRSNLYAWFRAP